MYAQCTIAKISGHLRISLVFWSFTGTHSAVSKSRQPHQQHSLFCFLLAVLNYSWHCLTPMICRQRIWKSLIFIGKIKVQVHSLILMSWLTGPGDTIFGYFYQFININTIICYCTIWEAGGMRGEQRLIWPLHVLRSHCMQDKLYAGLTYMKNFRQ